MAWIRRTWKRDGSADFMELPAASLNLAHNVPASGRTAEQAASDAMRRLLDGEVLRTRLAEFRLVRRYGEAS